MKIGILTYHRSHNFGAQLQAVALRTKLAAMGHSVCFINYWPRYHQQMYALFPPLQREGSRIKALIHYVKILLLSPRRHKRIRAMQKFMKEYSCPYWKPYDNKTAYDAVIYGSDQIWRKQLRLSNKFNPVYFGDNVLSTKKHIAYAASMGKMKLTPHDERFLKETLSRFDKISVRESDLNDELARLGINSQVTLDPTLLLQSQEWDKLLEPRRMIKENYALFYEITFESFDRKAMKQWARQHNLRFIEVKGRAASILPQKDVFDVVPPQAFVSLIKHAEMIFTSSYHGLVFSLLYNKKFYASYSNNAQRAKSLLQNLGIEHCLLAPLSPLPDNLPQIDYNQVNIKMQELRKGSLHFLKNL